MSSELKNKISLSSSLIDEAFDAKKALNYQLIIQIGMDGVELAVYDTVESKFIAFEKHAFQNVHSLKIIPDLWGVLAKSRKLLPHKYKSVKCVLVNKLSTLIPNPLFEKAKSDLYLQFNTTIDEADIVLNDDLKSLDAQNVFALPQELKQKLDALYGNVTYHHFSSALIESLLLKNKNSTKKKVYVHIRATHFEVVLIEGKKLIFYNTFNHQSPEDFIYYLLFSCDQLQLNPENVEMVLLGEIEKKSALYTIAHKYIRNLKFGARKCDAELSYQLQDLPKHYYFTVLNNYLL